MTRIELNEQFYEDEVREGFYIPASVKQAWGAQIRVLNEFDSVCEKLGIRYFADWGTFLGAVRHGGFIPWDDDFDICMLRDDYNRFLKEGVKLLPEGYTVYNFENRENHEQFIVGVVAKNRICFEEDHLERFHGFPYIAAIDVFLIDYMSDDSLQQEEMKKKAKAVLAVSDGIREETLSGKKLKDKLSELERNYGISVPEDLNGDKIRRFLDMEAEKLFASFLYKKDKAREVVQMMPWGLRDEKIMPAEYYRNTVCLPFETGTIPVPAFYNEVLRRKYGDYMYMYKNAGAHDYPFFAKSRAQLQEVLDFDLPEYHVDADELLKKARLRKEGISGVNTKDDQTYKAVALECIDEMEKAVKILMTKDISVDEIRSACVLIQQLALDLGNYMEAVKGEGYDIVHLLENLCEEAFCLSENTDDPSKVCAAVDEIKNVTKRRREVLFIPFKDDYWSTMDGLYRQMEEDPDTDVYVVPIPYYYKDFKKRLKDMQYRVEGYPKDVKITHYDEYDYKLRHPDIIITQNPYDDWNDEISLPPFFYTDKLLELTDKLVYIPWFETYDFTEENEREYKNMDSYCTVPGVMNADLIILGTETLKETYVKKLKEFAGDKTGDYFDGKIIVRGSDEEEDILGIRKIADEGKKSEGPSRKVMVYYPDFSDIMLFSDTAVTKIESTVKTFADNTDSLDYVIIRSRLIDEELSKIDPPLYDKIDRAFKGALGYEGISVVGEKDIDVNDLVRTSSAYYGDGENLAHLFRNAGKPVMIQNYEIQADEE